LKKRKTYNCQQTIGNLETEIDPIDRFYSLQDMELGVLNNQKETIEYIQEDIESRREDFKNGHKDGFDIEFNKLLFIGGTERGDVHLYCGEDRYGEIFYSNYSGGIGLEKTGLKSFTELLESLTPTNEDWGVLNNAAYKNWKLDKIFTFGDTSYWEEDIKEKGLVRFMEVLSFYGDPNKIHPDKEKDVVNYYINNPIILKHLADVGAKFPKKIRWIYNVEALKILVSQGLSTEGLLTKTRDFDVIEYLVKELKQDLNQAFEGKYPLLFYTDEYRYWSRETHYGFIKKILALDASLNLDITDQKGQSVRERIKILESKNDEN